MKYILRFRKQLRRSKRVKFSRANTRRSLSLFSMERFIAFFAKSDFIFVHHTTQEIYLLFRTFFFLIPGRHYPPERFPYSDFRSYRRLVLISGCLQFSFSFSVSLDGNSCCRLAVSAISFRSVPLLGEVAFIVRKMSYNRHMIALWAAFYFLFSCSFSIYEVREERWLDLLPVLTDVRVPH